VSAGKPFKTLFLWAFNDMEYSMISEKKQEILGRMQDAVVAFL